MGRLLLQPVRSRRGHEGARSGADRLAVRRQLMVPDRPWKRAEREIASRIGGERVPITGRVRGSEPDIRHEWLSVECKQRRRLPDWIRDAMDQAKASARGHQLPVAILHEAGTRYSTSLIVLELSDWLEWFGDVQRPIEEADMPLGP